MSQIEQTIKGLPDLPTLLPLREIQLAQGISIKGLTSADKDGGYGSLYEGRLFSPTEIDKKVAIKAIKINPCALLLSGPSGVDTFISQMRQEGISPNDASEIVGTIFTPYSRIMGVYKEKKQLALSLEDALKAMVDDRRISEFRKIAKNNGKTSGYIFRDQSEEDLAHSLQQLYLLTDESIILDYLSNIEQNEYVPKFYGKAERFDIENNTITASINIVMEYIEGKDLLEYRVAQDLIDSKKIRDIMKGACGAIASLHEIPEKKPLDPVQRLTLRHRDIKPSNFMVENETGNVRLIDLGLSIPVESGKNNSGYSAKGTLGYMSPNVLRDRSTTLKDNEIYSLGATMFYLLTKKDSYGMFCEKFTTDERRYMGDENFMARYIDYLSLDPHDPDQNAQHRFKQCRGSFIREMKDKMNESMQKANYPEGIRKRFYDVVWRALDMKMTPLNRYNEVSDMLDRLNGIDDSLFAIPADRRN